MEPLGGSAPAQRRPGRGGRALSGRRRAGSGESPWTARDGPSTAATWPGSAATRAGTTRPMPCSSERPTSSRNGRSPSPPARRSPSGDGCALAAADPACAQPVLEQAILLLKRCPAGDGHPDLARARPLLRGARPRPDAGQALASARSLYDGSRTRPAAPPGHPGGADRQPVGRGEEAVARLAEAAAGAALGGGLLRRRHRRARPHPDLCRHEPKRPSWSSSMSSARRSSRPTLCRSAPARSSCSPCAGPAVRSAERPSCWPRPGSSWSAPASTRRCASGPSGIPDRAALGPARHRPAPPDVRGGGRAGRGRDPARGDVSPTLRDLISWTYEETGGRPHRLRAQPASRRAAAGPA